MLWHKDDHKKGTSPNLYVMTQENCWKAIQVQTCMLWHKKIVDKNTSVKLYVMTQKSSQEKVQVQTCMLWHKEDFEKCTMPKHDVIEVIRKFLEFGVSMVTELKFKS